MKEKIKIFLESDLLEKYLLGNTSELETLRVAKALKAVAYINPVKKLSYINVSKLPNLPENQCFQMWAEVNGEMINLGIIEEATNGQNLMALPYAKNAVGYITIEPKGGNLNPTVDNIVANISY